VEDRRLQRREAAGAERRFRAVTAEELDIGAGLLLRRVLAQLPRENGGVRRVDDHEPAEAIRVRGGESPRHYAAPVVADQHRLLAGREAVEQFPYVTDQRG